MNTALAILCAGSVAFMLWFLVVLVKEGRAAAWPRPLKTYVARAQAVRTYGKCRSDESESSRPQACGWPQITCHRVDRVASKRGSAEWRSKRRWRHA